MADRDTKIIEAGDNKIELRTYLTGKESSELKAIMYADLKIDASDAASGKVGLADIPAAFMIKQEQKAQEFLVVSVNGDATNPIEALGNLREADYNAVLAEVAKIRVPFKTEK
jgi:hypothetical protein